MLVCALSFGAKSYLYFRLIPWIRAMSITHVPSFASQAELHSKGDRFPKIRVLNPLPVPWGLG